MAGRVLRSSNGRFAGSTKGWRAGVKSRGARVLNGIRKGPTARQQKTGVQIVRHTANRALYAGAKRVAINSGKIIVKQAARSALIGAGGALIASGVLKVNGLGHVTKSTLGASMIDGALMGAAAGTLGGAVSAAIRAPGTFRAAAQASVTTGTANRAAAKLRKINPKMSRSTSLKAVYKTGHKGVKYGKLLKAASKA